MSAGAKRHRVHGMSGEQELAPARPTGWFRRPCPACAIATSTPSGTAREAAGTGSASRAGTASDKTAGTVPWAAPARPPPGNWPASRAGYRSRNAPAISSRCSDEVAQAGPLEQHRHPGQSGHQVRLLRQQAHHQRAPATGSARIAGPKARPSLGPAQYATARATVDSRANPQQRDRAYAGRGPVGGRGDCRLGDARSGDDGISWPGRSRVREAASSARTRRATSVRIRHPRRPSVP